MPIVKRAIEPYYISRSETPVPARIDNTLQCIAVFTLANVLRQLGSLSKHSEDLFGELLSETRAYVNRAKRLQERVNGLSRRAKELDSATEPVSLEAVTMYRPFHSCHPTDQKLLSRASLPAALAECYENCSPPPRLNEFDKFREDQRASMTFYTDPDYFFNLWRANMEKQAKKKAQGRKHRKRNNPAAPVNVPSLNVKRHRAGVSEELDDDAPSDNTLKKSRNTTDRKHSTRKGKSKSGKTQNDNSYEVPPPLPPDRRPKRGESFEVVYDTPEPVGGGRQVPAMGPKPPPMQTIYYSSSMDDDLPPPPPPPTSSSSIDPPDSAPPPPPGPPMSGMSSTASGLPAPPPVYGNQAGYACPPPPGLEPPPMASAGAGPPPPPPPPPPPGASPMSPGPPAKPSRSPESFRDKLTSQNLQPASRPEPVVDSRANLLQQIRLGKQLRTVEKTDSSSGSGTLAGCSDVAGILARRIAIEGSDSEDDGSDWASDEEEWD